MLVETARVLHGRGHDVVLVVAPEGPQYAANAEEFGALADELGCPFLAARTLATAEVLTVLRGSGADVAISVNWPTIVPAPVFAAFRHGILNAHAGDLPRHRGNATINWAILTAEAEVVVTVHVMDAGLDSGPVLAKRRFPLDELTYVAEVQAFCDAAVPEMFLEVVDGLAEGSLTPVPQPGRADESLRCFPRVPADGWIDWSLDAVQLARLVRAVAEPFDGAYTMAGGDRLTIWRAHAEDLPYRHLGVPGQVVERRRATGEVAILTGAGILVLERVQTARVGIVNPDEVLRSTRQRIGLHVPTVIEDLSRRVAALEDRADPARPGPPSDYAGRTPSR